MAVDVGGEADLNHTASPHMNIKLKHWRGFQGKNAWKCAPILGFVLLILALSAAPWVATAAINYLASAPRVCNSMQEGMLPPDELASPALKRWVVRRCALPRPRTSSPTMLAGRDDLARFAGK